MQKAPGGKNWNEPPPEIPVPQEMEEPHLSTLWRISHLAPKIDRLQRKINRLEDAVVGNGKVGLRSRVEHLEWASSRRGGVEKAVTVVAVGAMVGWLFRQIAG